VQFLSFNERQTVPFIERLSFIFFHIKISVTTLIANINFVTSVASISMAAILQIRICFVIPLKTGMPVSLCGNIDLERRIFAIEVIVFVKALAFYNQSGQIFLR
jgi:hypothetical protein